MKKLSVSRREFLSGAAALGFLALPGGWLFASPPGWKPKGKPNLVFGVISDTHLRTANRGTRIGANWPDKYFAAALEYFKKQNVDAVVHCGDMAHRGQVEEMQFHANVWRRVFGGQGPVKLFVTGNHDAEGAKYGGFVEKNYPDPAERAKHVLATDMAANWERIWGEPYEEAWHKVVNGYHFFGQHYPTEGFDVQKTASTVNACRGDKTLGDGARPVFLLTHRRPHLSSMDKAVRPLANTFGFHGHWHKTATDWNVIGLEKGRAFPRVQCPACHSSRGEAFPMMCKCGSGVSIHGGNWKAWRSRQGFVVRMYDDMLVIERHEFDNGVASLGADWVMPLGQRKPHPFSTTELKKVIGEPEFRKGAKLVFEKCSAPPCLRVKIPRADGNPDSRVYAYEVEVSGEDADKKLLKAVYAAGCNMGIGHEPNHGTTTLEIPRSELPPGKSLTVAVRPLTSLGTSGRPIITDFKV